MGLKDRCPESGMRDKVDRYIKSLFYDAPANKKIAEYEKELSAECLLRFDNLVAEGKSEQEAFQIVISEIGDVESKIEELDEPEPYKPYEPEPEPEIPESKKQLFAVMSSGLWLIMIMFYFIISFASGAWHSTWTIFILASVFQTLLRLYFIPKGSRHNFVAPILWTSAALLYFVLSFATGKWEITWLIFLFVAIVQQSFRLFDIWKRKD